MNLTYICPYKMLQEIKKKCTINESNAVDSDA